MITTQNIKKAYRFFSYSMLRPFYPQKAKKHLIQMFDESTGLGAKFQQLLSQKIDLQPCQGPTPALCIEDIQGIIKTHLPELFKSIENWDTSPVCTSLAQVHTVHTYSQQTCVIKIQYPEIEASLKEQLHILKSLMETSPAKKLGFETHLLSQWLYESMAAELNYQEEAKSQNFFRKFVQQEHLPIQIAAIQNSDHKSILVQEHLSSDPLSSLKDQPFQLKKNMAEGLLLFLWKSLFITGKLHSDPHPGNWGWNPHTAEWVLYDFGSVLQITEKQKHIFINIFNAYKNNQKDFPIVEALLELGFSESKTQPIQQQLPAILKEIFNPLFSSRPWDFQYTDAQQSISKCLGAHKWTLRSAGPPWLLMLMRTITGTFNMIHHLGVKISPLKTLSQALGSAEAPAFKSSRSLHSQQLQDAPEVTVGFCASELHIQLTENGREKVNLTLPYKSVDNLEELMPAGIQQQNRHQNQTLKDKIESIKASGYQPQELWNETDVEAKKTVRIWLS